MCGSMEDWQTPGVLAGVRSNVVAIQGKGSYILSLACLVILRYYGV